MPPGEEARQDRVGLGGDPGARPAAHEPAIAIDRHLFSFEAGDRIVLNEAGCAGTIDGVPALVHLEAGWERSYAELQAARVRSRAAVGA